MPGVAPLTAATISLTTDGRARCKEGAGFRRALSGDDTCSSRAPASPAVPGPVLPGHQRREGDGGALLDRDHDECACDEDVAIYTIRYHEFT
mgnify:CR=1 FL=1